MRADLVGELELNRDVFEHLGSLAVVAACVDEVRFASRNEPGVVYAVTSQVVGGSAPLIPVEPPVVVRSQIPGVYGDGKGVPDQISRCRFRRIR